MGIKNEVDGKKNKKSVTTPNIRGNYLYERMMQIINNPQPLRKPPYSCPKSAYGKSKDCQFPNCTCEWHL